MDINKQVIRQIKESRATGAYSINTSYVYNESQFSNNAGYNNNTFNGGINPNNVDTDSFLKGISVKNSKAIEKNRNPMPAGYKAQESQVSGVGSINLTRDRKACNDIFQVDYTNRHFNPNLIDPQKYLSQSHDYQGIDSRHLKR